MDSSVSGAEQIACLNSAVYINGPPRFGLERDHKIPDEADLHYAITIYSWHVKGTAAKSTNVGAPLVKASRSLQWAGGQSWSSFLNKTDQHIIQHQGIKIQTDFRLEKYKKIIQ